MANKQLSYSIEELETFKERIEAIEGNPNTSAWKHEYIKNRSTEKTIGFLADSKDSPRLNLINLADAQGDNTVLARLIDWANTEDVISGRLSAFAMLGDFISDVQLTKIQYQAACAAFWAQAESSPIPVFTCLGNHECNHDGSTKANYCDKHDHRVYFYQPMLDLDATLVSDTNNADACYCYKDFDIYKTRVIALDQYDFPYVYDGDGTPLYSSSPQSGANIGYSEAQLNWLVAALNVANDWNVVILCHEGIAQKDEAVGGTDDCLIAILSAFKNKATVSTSATSPLSFTITGDFSTNSGNVIVIYGHLHSFLKSTVSGINQYRVMSSDPTTGSWPYIRHADSIISDAADIFSYSLGRDSFYFLRYGLINKLPDSATYDGNDNGFHYIDAPETF